jgi:flagellar basal-body rod protein FlgG
VIRGLYTSTSGLLANQAQNAIIAENVANIRTPGYQEKEGSAVAFPTLLMQKVAKEFGDVSTTTPIGQMGTGVYVNSVNIIDRPADLQPGSNTDLALTSTGFFTIQTPEGLRYTRKGDFKVTDQGELQTSEGYAVLGNNGPITNLTKDFKVGLDGSILMNNQIVDTLQIVDTPLTNLQQAGDSLYTAADAGMLQPAAQVELQQGMLEGSNVDMTGQMTKMITVMRAYEANQKVIQTEDSTLDKAVNEVGTVR